MIWICNKCGSSKDFGEFPLNKNTEFGRSKICKECRRNEYKEYYKTPEAQEKLKARRAVILIQNRRYRHSKKGRIVAINKSKRMRLKYPEKWSARSKLRYAVKKGTVKKLPCEVCKDPKSFGHHPDYNYPLLVTWLCMKHHREVHNNKS